MSSLEVIQINDTEKWDEIIKSFDNYDIHYLSGYVRAFQFNGEGIPLLFYYNDGNTRAINVVFKRDISTDMNFNGIIERNEYFDFSTPYGYGGFIIEGDNFEAVNRVYDEYCQKNNIICEFVRFSLFTGFEKKYNGQIEARTHNVVRTLNINPIDMMMEFEHKVRKNLKKANMNGLEIEIDTEGKSLDTFLEIYYNTMKRNEAHENFYFKKEFFEIINSMKNNIVYFNVYFQGKVISTELVIYSHKNCYSYLGGTLSEYFYLRPNEFLKYEIIKWAYEKKLKNFILGGGYSFDDGIFRYKKSFAPNGVCNFYVGRKIFKNDIYEMLVNIRRKNREFDENNMYFPQYRG